MKKIVIIISAVVCLSACNEQNSTGAMTTGSADTVVTNNVKTIPPGTNQDAGNASSADHTSTSTTYTPAEGDVIYRNNKLMVYRNNSYVEADSDINLGNGMIARRNGEVSRDGQVLRLHEGETMDRTGQFFDKAGKAIENAWEVTKKGLKKAAGEAEKAGKKITESVKDAVH